MTGLVEKKVRIGLAMAAMMMLGQISLVGQQTTANRYDLESPDTTAELGNRRGLEGVWDLTVTARNCQTGDPIRMFPAIHTYMFGGTMQDFGTGGAPLPRSGGHGVWSHDSSRYYRAAFQFFRFNADGSNAGRQINRVQIELSQHGDEYTSSSIAQTFDVAGNLIATNCFSATATRFE